MRKDILRLWYVTWNISSVHSHNEKDGQQIQDGQKYFTQKVINIEFTVQDAAPSLI